MGAHPLQGASTPSLRFQPRMDTCGEQVGSKREPFHGTDDNDANHTRGPAVPGTQTWLDYDVPVRRLHKRVNSMNTTLPSVS